MQLTASGEVGDYDAAKRAALECAMAAVAGAATPDPQPNPKSLP